MKPFLIAVSAAAVASPVVIATPAAAQSSQYRQELRECNRELSRARTRAEYQHELRECNRELARAQRYRSRYDNRYYGSRYYQPYGYNYQPYGYSYQPYGYSYGYPYQYGYDPYYGNGVTFGIRIR